MDASLLWVPVTLLAAGLQTARNAMQRGLVGSVGTGGATAARFVFGLPFGLAILGLVALLDPGPVPAVTGAALGFALAGALAQALATGLMLGAMERSHFAVATALIKTEPVLVALFGAALLGDHLSGARWGAIGVATLGVVLVALRPGAVAGLSRARPVALGLAAGALFGLSAVLYRGAILALPAGSAPMRAAVVLAISLFAGAALVASAMALREPTALGRLAAAWRPSLLAGFLGALGSAFWFLGFALTAAANVRTLALVEVVMAWAVARRLGAGGTAPAGMAPREALGILLVLAGVAGLLAAP